MTEELVDEQFKPASQKVDEAYDQAAEDLKSKVRKAKSDALKKLSS